MAEWRAISGSLLAGDGLIRESQRMPVRKFEYRMERQYSWTSIVSRLKSGKLDWF